VGEGLAEHLGVLVSQAQRVDIVPAVVEALEVGVTDASDTKLVEFVVLTDAGETDAVVDLTDFVQRVGRILGHDDDAIVVGRCDE